MADKISDRVASVQGSCGIREWMVKHVENQPGYHRGPEIECMMLDGTETKQALNRVGILFDNCRFMRQGSDENHGYGGSNCSTGNPVCFVDVSSVLPAVFDNQSSGILRDCAKPCFVLPLAMVADSPDLMVFVKDAYVNFVALKHGDNKHESSHVANGLSSGLAAICYALCKEFVLDGTVSKRAKFLVEALFLLGLTARSAGNQDSDCLKIFTLLPIMARTCDTFQSVLMGHLFGITIPEEIRCNMLAASIRRHFSKQKDESFLRDPPIGVIGLLLIAPMLASLISTTLETDDVVHQIVHRLDSIGAEIVRECAGAVTRSQNVSILKCFARSNYFFDPDKMEHLYNWSRSTEDISEALGIKTIVDFVETRHVKTNNFPVLVLSENNYYSYIPADPREWTGLHLKPLSKYTISATTLGLSEFQTGKTTGQLHIANFRFTAGNDVLSRSYDGYASTGMYFCARTQRYNLVENIANPLGIFHVSSDTNGIVVAQNERRVLFIPRSTTHLPVLISFKNCKVTISKNVEETSARKSLMASNVNW